MIMKTECTACDELNKDRKEGYQMCEECEKEFRSGIDELIKIYNGLENED